VSYNCVACIADWFIPGLRQVHALLLCKEYLAGSHGVQLLWLPRPVSNCVSLSTVVRSSCLFVSSANKHRTVQQSSLLHLGGRLA